MLAFTIDFEGFVEGMEESFGIPDRFPRFEIRDELVRNLDRCLMLLDEHGVKATFFVLGWIARDYPDIARRIAAAGHELGSHSMHHRRLWSLPPDLACEYIGASKRAIEDATGAPVLGFRAPDCSLAENSALFDALAGSGYRYDSTINPTNIHDVYGTKTRRTEIWRLSNGLVEFPIPTVLLLRRFSLTVGGGGYFRVFPYSLTARWLRRCDHPLTYLHPYEVGGVFPAGIPATRLRRFRHMSQCGKLDAKLARLFNDFQSVTALDYLRRHGAIG